MTTETEMQETIRELLYDAEIDDVQGFDEAGVLTNNAGLMIRLDDGSEFCVAIVQSR